MLTIEARTTNRRRELIPRWQVPVPPEASGGRGLTLRELIDRVVRAEVEEYATRRRGGRLMLVLSERDIDAGAEGGRVQAGGSAPRTAAPEPDAAVAVALEAFEDGLYLVVIDGRQYESLEEQVMLGDSSTMTFMRLVALAGGC
jgi:hypothetical protein